MSFAIQTVRIARVPFLLARRTRVSVPAGDPYLSEENELYFDAEYIPSGTADLWRGSRPRGRR